MSTSASVSKKGALYPGWLVVAAGFLIMATCYTTFINCMALFQSQIVRDLGVSLSEYNLSSSISTLMSIVGAAAVGILADRVSSHILGSLSVVITSAVLIGLSFITQLWQLYALIAVAGVVVVAGTRLLISLVTANWFTAKRGLAISIALSGSGFGGAVLSPVVSSLITSYGWRPTMLVLAVICFVASFPITALAFRTRPQDVGLLPYGAAPAASGAVSPAASGAQPAVGGKPVVELDGLGWARVRKSSSFWLLVGAFVLMGVVNLAVLANQVTNMTEVTVSGQRIVTGGHSLTWAGSVMSAYMVTVVVAKISLGAIYDKFGLRTGNILGSVACIVACIALCFPQTDAGPVIAAIAFGIGTCMGTVAPTVAASKLYGMRDLGTISGWITSLEMAGGVVSSLMSGMIFDAFHSFAPMWIICAACSVFMLAGLLAAESTAPRLE